MRLVVLGFAATSLAAVALATLPAKAKSVVREDAFATPLRRNSTQPSEQEDAVRALEAQSEARDTQVAVVLSGPLLVREKPTPKARVVGTLLPGAQVEVATGGLTRDGWLELSPIGYLHFDSKRLRVTAGEPRDAPRRHLAYARAEAQTPQARAVSGPGGTSLLPLPPLRRRSYYRVVRELELAQRRWSLTADGTALPSDLLTPLVPAEASPPPVSQDTARLPQVTPETCAALFGRCPDKVLELSTDQRLLFALEGGRVVFAIRVAIGREGVEELRGRERVSPGKTPLGVFKILGKHKSLTMTSSGSSVVHQDVPWTLHFWGPYAIHGAYWHDQFGSNVSGGCVNVSLSDGETLFEWTTPTLPAGWHSMTDRTGTQQSTTLWIHR